MISSQVHFMYNLLSSKVKTFAQIQVILQKLLNVYINLFDKTRNFVLWNPNVWSNESLFQRVEQNNWVRIPLQTARNTCFPMYLWCINCFVLNISYMVKWDQMSVHVQYFHWGIWEYGSYSQNIILFTSTLIFINLNHWL